MLSKPPSHTPACPQRSVSFFTALAASLYTNIGYYSPPSFFTARALKAQSSLVLHSLAPRRQAPRRQVSRSPLTVSSPGGRSSVSASRSRSRKALHSLALCSLTHSHPHPFTASPFILSNSLASPSSPPTPLHSLAPGKQVVTASRTWLATSPDMCWSSAQGVFFSMASHVTSNHHAAARIPAMTHASSLGERSPDTPHAPITCARERVIARGRTGCECVVGHVVGVEIGSYEDGGKLHCGTGARTTSTRLVSICKYFVVRERSGGGLLHTQAQ